MKSDLNSNKLPLHVALAETLAREIRAGILTDGTRLPSERALAESLGVAVGTLRKALQDLADKGLLERKHGSGNYVRNRPTEQSSNTKTVYDFFRLELIAGGGLPTADVLTVSKVTKPAGFASIGDSNEAFCIRRLRRLNNIDAALEEVWIDGSWLPSLTKTELHDSLYWFYKNTLGFWISRVEDSVSVETVPSWMPKSLHAKVHNDNLLWGFVERLSYDQNNVCVEYSRTWFNPATTRYVARWK